MRDTEAADIAEPLSRIAARHSPVTAGEETSDIFDTLEAGLAGGSYAMRAYIAELDIAGEEQQAAANAGDMGPGR